MGAGCWWLWGYRMANGREHTHFGPPEPTRTAGDPGYLVG